MRDNPLKYERVLKMFGVWSYGKDSIGAVSTCIFGVNIRWDFGENFKVYMPTISQIAYSIYRKYATRTYDSVGEYGEVTFDEHLWILKHSYQDSDGCFNSLEEWSVKGLFTLNSEDGGKLVLKAV